MSHGSFANEKVMEDYLSSLLTEVPSGDPVQRQAVARLLKGVAPVAPNPSVEVVEDEPEAQITEPELDVQEAVKAKALAEKPPVSEKPAKSVPTEAFQALYFEVAGLVLAVPLTSLGGIHQLEKVGPLFGKPDWFKGVMLHRDEKLNVVDTAQWVMPEKYDEKLAESLNYQYLIMLDNSSWGLACERLVTTATLQPDEVKWREATGKRPWLAGMVKEKMCALIDVKQLITMLNQGLGSNDE